MRHSLRIRFTLLLLLFCSIASADEAYVITSGTETRIGNAAVERVFTQEGGRAGTSAILNKLSGVRYRVTSEEFALSIVFAGFGPAAGKEQNGENPSVLTAKDFRFAGMKERTGPNGSRTLTLMYSFDRYQANLRVAVHHEVHPGVPYMRKWVEVADSAGTMHFLHKIDVETMAFHGVSPGRGAFGQPVFAGDVFVGVEYPGVENVMEGTHISSGYVIGTAMNPQGLASETGILGVAGSPQDLARAFLRYVETIKVRGTRPYLLYNTWYDVRHPARVKDPSHAMTESVVLERIDAFRRHMQVPHDITLDAFVLDDGWDNVESIWRIDSSTFPRGFTRLAGELKKSGTKLGMWASPFCGYDMRDQRVRWGAAHGYEHTGNFLCFAGEKYGKEFKERMVGYTRDYGIGYFKWDGFLLACNETGHGHLPGIYSRTALISTFADMMAAVREVNPDVFVNITVGTWLSPWWLRYADCVWMQGEDYAYAEDVPSLNPRDKAITYRDAVLWGNFGRQDLLFPVSSMMTHGIIKGRLNLLGGETESLESFTNETLMYFGRGVMMWELYVSPDALSSEEWHAIASCVKWARGRKDLLADTRMIGGDPLARAPYGFAHSRGDRALVLLRNPSVRPAHIAISLDRDLGFSAGAETWRAAYTYPYTMVMAPEFHKTDSLRVPLGSYEVVMIEVLPSGEIPAGTPLEIRYARSGDSLSVFATPGTRQPIRFAGLKDQETVQFSGSEMGLASTAADMHSHAPGLAVVSGTAQIPAGGSAEYGLLLEPAERLTGDATPQIRAEVDGAQTHCSIEQEGGKWFWVTVPLPPGEHHVSIRIESSKPLNGKAEAWLFSRIPLARASMESRITAVVAPELPFPYPASVEKGSRLLRSYELEPVK